MLQVIRAQYRAVLKENVSDEQFRECIGECLVKIKNERKKGWLLTAAMFQYKNWLFLYMEYIMEEKQILWESKNQIIGKIPDEWFEFMKPVLHEWPEYDGKRYWTYMYPVFWFDMPVSLECWRRKQGSEKRCGRIAVLYPDMFASYISHHHEIVEEGLLVGDRFQMISVHENILFSYFETPRDREQVNIRRLDQESEEIKRWEAVHPEKHFFRFKEDPNENFFVIRTLFSVG